MKSKCSEWHGGRDQDGYGITHFEGKTWRVHRLVWSWVVGEIPKGKFILHDCDNPPCYNPEHLFMGDSKSNVQDALNKERMLGPRGEMNGQHKLTAVDVVEIASRYKRYDKNGNNIYDLAREFGVHPVTIHDILSGRHWRSVTKNN
jgi:hypothetical protein